MKWIVAIAFAANEGAGKLPRKECHCKTIHDVIGRRNQVQKLPNTRKKNTLEQNIF